MLCECTVELYITRDVKFVHVLNSTFICKNSNWIQTSFMCHRIALPPVPSTRPFWARHCPLCPQAAMGSHYRPGQRWVRLAIAPPRAPVAEAQAADLSLINSVCLSARAFLHRTAWWHSCQLNFASLRSGFYHWSVNENAGMRGVKPCGLRDRRQH